MSYPILPVVLYGCETWSPTLREEHRLRLFENRVLRGTSRFVPTTRYYQADQIKETEVGGASGIHGRGEKSAQGFGGKA
jgi:hypothetical protein